MARQVTLSLVGVRLEGDNKLPMGTNKRLGSMSDGRTKRPKMAGEKEMVALLPPALTVRSIKDPPAEHALMFWACLGRLRL